MANEETTKVLKARDATIGENTITLSTGVEVIISPVSAVLIETITTSVKEPVVPTWINKDQGNRED